MLDKIKSMTNTVASKQDIINILSQRTTWAGVLVLGVLWGLDIEQLNELLGSLDKLAVSVGAVLAILYKSGGDAE